jgi:hypothetical protein
MLQSKSFNGYKIMKVKLHRANAALWLNKMAWFEPAISKLY